MIFAIFCYSKSKKMKAKNVIILGAIGVALYYLLKKEKPSFTELPDEADTDLEDVINGDEPSSMTPKISQADKQVLFNQASKYYEGGARPTEKMLQEMKMEREKAMAKIKALGLSDEFEKFFKKLKEERKKLKDYLGKPSSPPPLTDLVLNSASDNRWKNVPPTQRGSRPPIPSRGARR